MADEEDAPPIVSAVSSSARQLFLLLRCIAFGSKALVQPMEEGLRFSVEETGVMEGMTFLSRSLFTTYTFNAPPLPSTTDSSQPSHQQPPVTTAPPFTISLPALLETLQIFGLSAPQTPHGTWSSHADGGFGDRYGAQNDAFSAHVLGISGLVRLSYARLGAPLRITLEETNLSTACELVTYEPDFYGTASSSDDPASPTTATPAGQHQAHGTIPFARDQLLMKIILPAAHLADALAELAASNPDVLTITAHSDRFVLAATGATGEASVSFARGDGRVAEYATQHQQHATPGGVPAGPRPSVLETFNVAPASPTSPPDDDANADPSTTTTTTTTTAAARARPAFRQCYKFSHVAATRRALSSALKASVRGDVQGVLSMQFMIENVVEGGGKGSDGAAGGQNGVSFVDFRFVPVVGDGEDD